MSIDAVRDERGFPRACCICDECGFEEVVPASHNRHMGDAPQVNEGQAIKKLSGMGWSFIKHKLRCPKCETRRRVYAQQKSAHQVPERWKAGGENYPIKQESGQLVESTNVEPIRKPDGKQKRLIVLALEDAYDDAAKRYKGGNTDKLLAEEIGAGIMPGWVASLREELFGPAGNEEIEAIRAEIEAIRSDTETRLAAMLKRLDACVSDHDKRVRA